MKLTLVIPVYNEEDSLYACLSAAVRQDVPFDQIIVVDNNSSDSTAVIASSFEEVTLIHEPRQGVIHARTTGFDSATGDIIARIDADTIIPSDWSAHLLQIFADPSIDAVSGRAAYYGIAYNQLWNSADLYFRRRLNRLLADRNFLWGANMAITRSAWLRVRPHLCHRADIHEDFDLGIHLQEIGGKVAFDEDLPAEVSSRRVDTDYLSFLRYAWASPSTYATHSLKHQRHMYPVIALSAVAYFPARLLYRGYDELSGSFSLSQLLSTKSESSNRVDPTRHVEPVVLD